MDEEVITASTGDRVDLPDGFYTARCVFPVDNRVRQKSEACCVMTSVVIVNGLMGMLTEAMKRGVVVDSEGSIHEGLMAHEHPEGPCEINVKSWKPLS